MRSFPAFSLRVFKVGGRYDNGLSAGLFARGANRTSSAADAGAGGRPYVKSRNPKEGERIWCEKNVFLKGATSDVPSILARAKAFLLTSNYEGMPNALMEALAIGVPSISTDCPCGGIASL